MPEVAGKAGAQSNTAAFVGGAIWKNLLRFAIPLFFGNILQQLYAITDSVIVGRLIGPSALAAIGASQPIVRLSISIAVGITLGVSVLTARFVGSGDTTKVRQVVSTCRLFFSLLAIAVTIPGVLLSRELLTLFRTPPEILDDAAAYLRAMFLGVYPMLGYNVFAAVFRGFGNAKVPLLMLALSTVLNVGLDLLTVEVFHLGVEGTAWATMLSQVVALKLASVYLRRGYSAYFEPARKLRVDPKLLKACLKIGIPSGVKGTAYWGGISLLTSVVNSFGAAATAAFSVASRVDALLQAPLISLQMSLAAFAAQNIGAGKTERVRKGMLVSMLIGMVFAAMITVSVYIFAPAGMRVFTSDEQIIAMGAEYLRTVCLFYVVYAWQEVIQGVAVGAGDTLILLISTITAMWVLRVPLAYILSARMGVSGVWLSMPSGWIVAAVFAQGYYSSGRWQRKLNDCGGR